MTFQYYGIPQHFGLFYAMGGSLIMEGLLSACYHICPNNSNYQFGKILGLFAGKHMCFVITVTGKVSLCNHPRRHLFCIWFYCKLGIQY